MKNGAKYVFLMFTVIVLINIQPCLSFNEIQLLNYIKLKQIWEPTDEYGGFKNSVLDENASIEITAKAIVCLNELQVTNQTIYDGALSYISGCEQFEGGFSIDSTGSIPNLRSTYWAISALNSIQNLDWVSTNTIIWIANRQLLNISEPWNYGGFENKANTSSATTEYTFYGIIALNQMAKLNSINTTAATLWLKSRQLPDGGFEYLDGFGFSDLASSFYAVSALSALNRLELMNISSIISFMTQKQNLNLSDPMNYGGFGDTPDIICTGMETFFAISSLHILNAINRINITAATLFLENLQLDNGAFTIAQGVNQPCISFSYFALTALSISSLYEEKDGQNGSNEIVFWVLLMLIIGISSILAIKYVKSRLIKGSRLKLNRRKKIFRRTIPKRALNIE